MTVQPEEQALELAKATIENPWRNVYWFLRMLKGGDKYGAPGDKIAVMSALAAQIEQIVNDHGLTAEDRLIVAKAAISNSIRDAFAKSKAKTERIEAFLVDILIAIESANDLAVFVFTIQWALIPTSAALDTVPSDDKVFAEDQAKNYLDALGEAGLATVINMWDDLGVTGCLTAERQAIVREHLKLRREISTRLTEHEQVLVLTAFDQEFERRLSQKRKTRSGGSLEDVASFIFDYYNIAHEQAPSHFKADIEVDKWIRAGDGWLIGISCKRTLRERWKQVSSADRGVLSSFKIRQVWHLLTYDEDLSDSKIGSLGAQGHVFYLKDDSRILKIAQQNEGMLPYVRPMSKFIVDVREQQGRKGR